MKSKPTAVFIADSPMTLGVQFLMGYLNEQPIGKEYDIYGILAGHPDSNSINESINAQQLEHLYDFLKNREVRLLGISTTERTKERIIPSIEKKREFFLRDTVMIAGGVDASSKGWHGSEYFSENTFDAIVLGDGEIPVEKILIGIKNWKNGKTIDAPIGVSPTWALYNNLRTKQVFDRKEKPIVASSPKILPLPYYGPNLLTLTNGGLVSQLDSANPSHVQFLKRQNAIDMYTQRGCTHNCNFCAQDLAVVYQNDSVRNSRKRSLDDIVRHIKKIKEEYPNKDYVYFWDLDFLRRPKQELLQFSDCYKEIGIPYFIFATEKSVNQAGEEVLRKLAQSGLSTINLGLQSGSQRILNSYNRNNTIEEAKKAINIIYQSMGYNKGNEILYDIITNNPNETPEDILATINLVASIPTKDYVKTRLATHALSYNSGQTLDAKHKTTTIDYQDWVNQDIQSQSPYLTFLLGEMMRGEITKNSIGSIRRSYLPKLIDPEFVKYMDFYPNKIAMQNLFGAFIPRDNEIFLGGS